MKIFKKGEKGFTLIELLIVIVILGILAAAIIPNLSKFMTSGQVGAANAELASVRTGIAAYMADNDGTLPAAGTDLDETAIEEYITGSSGIIASYTVDDEGTITGGTVTGTIWDGVIVWGTDKWEKAP